MIRRAAVRFWKWLEIPLVLLAFVGLWLASWLYRVVVKLDESMTERGRQVQREWEHDKLRWAEERRVCMDKGGVPITEPHGRLKHCQFPTPVTPMARKGSR